MKTKWINLPRKVTTEKPPLGKLPFKFRWANFKRELYGNFLIEVERIAKRSFEKGEIVFASDFYTKLFIKTKWYRVCGRLTRRAMQDMEGEYNAGLPKRFRRAYKDFNTDTVIFVIVPFHIIIPWIRLMYEWFAWKNTDFVYDIELRWFTRAIWISGFKYSYEMRGLKPPPQLDCELLYEKVSKEKNGESS